MYPAANEFELGMVQNTLDRRRADRPGCPLNDPQAHAPHLTFPAPPPALQSRASTTQYPCSAYRERMAFLSYLPTLVRGISSTNVHRSGNHQRATLSARNVRSCGALTDAPCLVTTTASGRSCQRSSGTPTTAASSTWGCPTRQFSNSTDEIHSPPDLITSLARSVSVTKPRSSRRPTSPVRNQPESNFDSSCPR